MRRYFAILMVITSLSSAALWLFPSPAAQGGALQLQQRRELDPAFPLRIFDGVTVDSAKDKNDLPLRWGPSSRYRTFAACTSEVMTWWGTMADTAVWSQQADGAWRLAFLPTAGQVYVQIPEKMRVTSSDPEYQIPDNMRVTPVDPAYESVTAKRTTWLSYVPVYTVQGIPAERSIVVTFAKEE